MKKTLILVLTCLSASVSMGALIASSNTQDLISGNGSLTSAQITGNNTQVGSGSGNFGFSMAIDVNALKSALASGTSNNFFTVHGTGGYHIGLGTVTSESSSGIQGTWNNGNPSYSLTGNGSNLNDFSSLLADATDLGLTMLVSNKGVWVAYSITLSDGTVTTAFDFNNAGLKAGGFGSLASISYDPEIIKYINLYDANLEGVANSNAASQVVTDYKNYLASIPEPSSATLGLLGLGCLMLRRRRK